MASTFQKLGVDRISQNIARAVNSPRGSLVTGDITAGEVVSLTLTADLSNSTTVSERRTGALELGRDLSGSTFITLVDVSGGKLTVVKNNGVTGTITYWVF